MLDLSIWLNTNSQLVKVAHTDELESGGTGSLKVSKRMLRAWSSSFVVRVYY
jgi:hypothetical protein